MRLLFSTNKRGTMKEKTKLYIAEIPAVSHEFAQRLSQVFPAKEIKPGVSHEELQYNAGERRVVDWVLRQASGSVISGDIKDLKPTEKNKSLLDKILGIVR